MRCGILLFPYSRRRPKLSEKLLPTAVQWRQHLLHTIDWHVARISLLLREGEGAGEAQRCAASRCVTASDSGPPAAPGVGSPPTARTTRARADGFPPMGGAVMRRAVTFQQQNEIRIRAHERLIGFIRYAPNKTVFLDFISCLQNNGRLHSSVTIKTYFDGSGQ